MELKTPPMVSRLTDLVANRVSNRHLNLNVSTTEFLILFPSFNLLLPLSSPSQFMATPTSRLLRPETLKPSFICLPLTCCISKSDCLCFKNVARIWLIQTLYNCKRPPLTLNILRLVPRKLRSVRPLPVSPTWSNHHHLRPPSRLQPCNWYLCFHLFSSTFSLVSLIK